MNPSPSLTINVASGHVTVLRLFDFAYTIDLGKAEFLWARYLRPGTRSKFTHTPKKAVDFGSEAPLTLAFPTRSLQLQEPQGTIEVEAKVSARLYVFGVVTFAVQIFANNLSWEDYTARVNAVEQAIGSRTEATLWSELVHLLREQISETFFRPNSSELIEDYLIATVHHFTEPLSATRLMRDLDLIPLLSGEHRELSESAKADLLSRRFSYYTDDLVILTWDKVFIYEPQQTTEVAEVIEVANAQFLEMRHYDELLDAELPRMYDLVEEARGRRALGPRRCAELARRLYTLVAEVTELTEKVDNALQVTEDVYLARIYAAALDLFRVKTVANAVDRKLAIIRDTYAALYDEAASSRAGLMEAAVIILIFFEVLLALLTHFGH